MEIRMHQGEPQAPEPEKVKELLAKCRPEIVALFQRHWVSAEEADEMLDVVFTTLLVRWDRITDPQAWVRAAVDKAIRTRLLLPIFRPGGPGNPD